MAPQPRAQPAPRVRQRHQGDRGSAENVFSGAFAYSHRHHKAKCEVLQSQLCSGAAYLRVLELQEEGEEDVQRVDPALVHGDVQNGCG